MYLLKGGLLFGFKKPILFIPYDDLHSFSFQCVSRNFDLVLSLAHSPNVELSMLPKDDLDRIKQFLNEKKSRKKEEALPKEKLSQQTLSCIDLSGDTRPERIDSNESVNSEEEDEDYDPSDKETIPEDFDETYVPPDQPQGPIDLSFEEAEDNE